MGVRFSTGCVSSYVERGCGGPDLPEAVPEGGAFRSWYLLSTAKNVLISRWDNADVWASDFREAGGGDLDSGGGADYPDLYFFAGHGSCQGPPMPTSPDFLITCGNFGKPDVVDIQQQSRFGNGFGHLKFLDRDHPSKSNGQSPRITQDSADVWQDQPLAKAWRTESPPTLPCGRLGPRLSFCRRVMFFMC